MEKSYGGILDSVGAGRGMMEEMASQPDKLTSLKVSFLTAGAMATGRGLAGVVEMVVGSSRGSRSGGGKLSRFA